MNISLLRITILYVHAGNQLLRKMGWSEGKGLGRCESGIEDPLVAKGIVGNSKAGT